MNMKYQVNAALHGARENELLSNSFFVSTSRMLRRYPQYFRKTNAVLGSVFHRQRTQESSKFHEVTGNHKSKIVNRKKIPLMVDIKRNHYHLPPPFFTTLK